MLSNGISYQDNLDIVNNVYGRVFADLACYILSNVGVGPEEIVMVADSNKSTLRYLYAVYLIWWADIL